RQLFVDAFGERELARGFLGDRDTGRGEADAAVSWSVAQAADAVRQLRRTNALATEALIERVAGLALEVALVTRPWTPRRGIDRGRPFIEDRYHVMAER